MKRTLVRGLSERVGAEVKVQGWVHAVRDQKERQFLIVRDHTGRVQVTVERSPERDEMNSLISRLPAESAVQVVGTVVQDARVKLAGIEVWPREVSVLNQAEAELPIDISGASESRFDKRLDWRYLDLRNPRSRLIFEVQTAVEEAMREYWHRQGFLEIHSPKLMGAASESGAELFRVDYFGRSAFLAQSPQFYKQMAMAAGFDSVFEIGPVFRANPSFTGRHDTEFTSVDVEMAWIDSHEDIMRFEENWLAFVLERVVERYRARIAEEFGAEVTIPSTPFPRMSFAQALQIARHRRAGERMGYDADLGTEDERTLGAHVLEEHHHEFVFVTDYPAAIRPFYHMRLEQDPATTKSYDLLWNGLEVTTGAQREHRYETLVRQAREKGLSLEPIQDYLGFFRFGCPPHGGFGFGLTRMLMILLGISNVREVTFVPRDPNRLNP